MNLEALSFECRQNVLDMIMEGRAGHIGGDFSVMDILITLYFKQMNISPDNLDDPDRDLFVMSKGHSVEAYYAVLAAKGFLDIEDVIKNFSKFGSPYIGHPNNKLPGIEMNSGSLGHGLPVCVGKALATALQQIDKITRNAVTQANDYLTNGTTGLEEKQLVDCVVITKDNADKLDNFVFAE